MERFLKSPVLVFTGMLALGLLIFWPYIPIGFTLDDFFWVSIIEEGIPYRRWVGLWDVDAAQFISFKSLWWCDATEDVGRFWRPLFSLIMEGSLRTLGRAAAPWLHLLTILLHVLVAWTGYLMLWRLSGQRIIALLAGLLFLICEDHSMTVGWISTSTDLLAVLFMNLSVLLYVLFRERQSRWLLFLSLLSFVVALAGKETAVVTPIAILLYEWLMVAEKKGDSIRETLKHFLAAAPSWGGHVLILGSFLIAYGLLGFGARSLAYYDPFHQPLIYLQNASLGLGILLAGWLTPLPIGLTLFVPSAAWPVAIAGVLLFILLIGGLWPLRQEPAVRLCLVLLFVAVLPQLSADASERQLYYPLIPGSYLLSRLIFRWPPLSRGLSFYGKGNEGDGLIFTKILPATIAISAGVLAFALSIVYSFEYSKTFTATERRVVESMKILGTKTAGPIVYLNAPDPFFPFYVNDTFRYHNGRYLQVYPLSGFYGRLEIRRTGPNSFALRTDRPGWITNMFARIVRQDRRVHARYSMPGFSAHPVAITGTPSGVEDVLETEFRFERPLEAVPLLYFDGEHIRSWVFPNQGDGWHLVADTSDVMKSMSQ